MWGQGEGSQEARAAVTAAEHAQAHELLAGLQKVPNLGLVVPS